MASPPPICEIIKLDATHREISYYDWWWLRAISPIILFQFKIEFAAGFSFTILCSLSLYTS